jgi:nicotinate-nucleotide adenylyltransferase
MATVALLGGSFNPPHLGHQMMALWVLSTQQAEQLWLLPSFHHPLGKVLEAYEHRVAMCHLALNIFAPSLADVCCIEEELPYEGKTLFTLRALQQRHPQHRFCLVIGADILKEKDEWYHFEEIEKMVPLIVLGREGYPSPSSHPTLPDISSSEIRARIRSRQEVSSFVPSAVMKYIEEHQLYV